MAACPVLEPAKNRPAPTIRIGKGMVRASRSSGYETLAPTATACIGFLRAAAVMSFSSRSPLLLMYSDTSALMASGLTRWRMSLAVSATLLRSCSTVSVRPARVCSVSRLICCNERVSVCGMTQSSVTNYLKPEPPMMAFVPDDATGATLGVCKSRDRDRGLQRARRLCTLLGSGRDLLSGTRQCGPQADF